MSDTHAGAPAVDLDAIKMRHASLDFWNDSTGRCALMRDHTALIAECERLRLRASLVAPQPELPDIEVVAAAVHEASSAPAPQEGKIMRQWYPDQELIGLRWKEGMLVKNHFGDWVWLKPCVTTDGQRIGITDCCFAMEPCPQHDQIIDQRRVIEGTGDANGSELMPLPPAPIPEKP